MKTIVQNWKTTLCGVLALIGTNVAIFFPEYARYGNFLSAVAGGAGLLFARDGEAVRDKNNNKIPLLLLLIVPALFFVGCASFTTEQTDTSKENENGTERTITTRATSRTFFESKSELAKFKASQTDKTQSASVGSLSQEATASNLVQTVRVVIELPQKAAKTAAKAAVGLP